MVRQSVQILDDAVETGGRGPERDAHVVAAAGRWRAAGVFEKETRARERDAADGVDEFTIATLSAFHTFPTYIQYINETQAYPAAAVSLMSFAITWAAMLSILLVGRRRGVPRVQVAGRARCHTSSCRSSVGRSATSRR